MLNVSSTGKLGAEENIEFANRSCYFDGGILPPNPLGAASPPPSTPFRFAPFRFSRFQAARNIFLSR